MPPTLALEDGVAAHFVDGKLSRIASARPNARAYHVETRNGTAVETALPPDILL